MASSRDYLNFILSQIESLGDVSSCQMMGEYIIYYRGKIIGGIYDNRFLIKPVQSVVQNISGKMVEPYCGAKQMFLIDDIENRDVLCGVVQKVYDELYNKKTPKN